MAPSPRPFLLYAVLAGACVLLAPPAHGQVTASGERIQYARVVAKDYLFDAPSTLGDGIVTFQLANQGSDVHQLSIVEIGSGHTIKQFFDVMRSSGMPPAWAVTVAMTPTIQPGTEAFVTLRLVPGHYVLACMIPARDGRSHVEKGMYRWVDVVARPKPATPAAVKKP